jgi:Rieske Fe-S protein
MDKERDENKKEAKSLSPENRRNFIKKIAVTGGILLASPLLKFCGDSQDNKETENNGTENEYEPTLYDIPEDGKTLEYAGDNLIITREGKKVYALSLVCTHQQCIVNFLSSEDRFVCPCHAAMYNTDGSKIQGPQPRGLDRYKVKLQGKTKIEINTTATYKESDSEYNTAFVTLP